MVWVTRWCQILGPPGAGTVEEPAGRAEGLTPPRLCCIQYEMYTIERNAERTATAGRLLYDM